MKTKTTLIWCAVALLVIGLLLGIYFATRPATQVGQKAFTVTVVHADGSSKDFSYKSNEEYLGTVLLAKGLVEGEQDKYGLFMKVVDGEKAVYDEDGAYWSLYVGEEYASAGIDATPITDGGVYKLVYTPA